MADPDPRYRETLKLFDALTAENDMKMYYQRPTRAMFDFAVGDAMVAFAAANSQQVHGHTLIWCTDSSTPGLAPQRQLDAGDAARRDDASTSRRS